MNIPQWKKELAQRKQQFQQQKCGGFTQLSYPATKPPNNQQSHLQSTRSGTNEQQQTVSKAQHVENHCTTDDLVNLPNNCCNLTKQPSLTSSESNLLSVCKQCSWCSKMVKNTSVLVEETHIKMPNNIIHDNNKNDESDSDSMEELQYGPGIVNKLKCRYLSLTLRETKIKSRPSLLRRAASLENILDEPVVSEEDELESHNSQRNHKENNTDRLFISRRDAPGGLNATNTRNSRANRYNSNRGDSMKRARSVETLIRYNSLSEQSENVMHMSVNENIVIIERDDNEFCTKKPFKPEIFPKSYDIITPKINRPKRIPPLMDETERPPAEIVKTKLKIFESTAKKFRSSKPVGEVAVKVDKFRNIIENDKAKKKPIIKPKPSADKLNNKSSLVGKKITTASEKPVCRPVSAAAKLYHSNSVENSENGTIEPVKCTIETIKPDEELKSRPDISKITELFEKSTSFEHHEPALPRLNTQVSQNENMKFQTRSQNESSAKTIIETPPLSLSPSPVPKLNGSVSEISEDNLDASANFPKSKNSSVTHTPVPEVKSTRTPTPENESKESETPHEEESDNAPSKSTSDDESEDTFYSCEGSKPITKLALDNISTASTTVHFRFEANPITKSYLPGINPTPKPSPRTILTTTSTIAQAQSQNSVDIIAAETTKSVIEIPNSSTCNQKFPLKWSHQETVAQVIGKDDRNHITGNDELPLRLGIEKTERTESLITNNKIESLVQVKTEQLVLTNREIEKNLINSVKTLQQTLVTPLPSGATSIATNRVVSKTSDVENCLSVTNHSGNNVSSDSSKLASSSSSPSLATTSNNQTTSLWNQKPWHQQQSNTMVFNFSHRKEVPDYIENDGIIRRPKREKPKPGEGGIIILADAPEDESCTDDFDDAWALRGPPSPCDVEFENDNILIDGKSCFISKFPKRQKLKIQFDDAATATYEYPSESSLMDESSLSSTSLIAISTANNNTGSSTVSPAAHPSLGTKLQNYTPSKVVLNTEYFQLGVTRTSQPTSVPLRNSSPTPKTYENENSHIKPSADVDNVSWGSETVPDLLF